MTKDKAKEIHDLYSELESIKLFRTYLNHTTFKDHAHIQFVQHGNLGSKKIVFNARHTSKFIPIIEEIIKEIENKIEAS